jgi:UDP-N-acetylglucosamine 2-epimerase (non-hydrolysing)
MNICIVLSTRPEIIKLSPIIQKLKEKKDNYYLINTGQHTLKKMSKVFFNLFKIKGKIFNIKSKTKTQNIFFSSTIKEISKILENNKPDFLIVQGDTNTSLAGCLAASLLNRNLTKDKKIKIVHIESGLRSFDNNMPEEINRKIIDQLSDVLFVPTKFDFNNLKKENCLKNKKTFVVGNTISDVLKKYIPMAQKIKILEKLDLKKKNFFLVTIHRPESVDIRKNIISLFQTFNIIAKKYDNPIIFPIHPRTKDKIKKLNLKIDNRIKIIEPLEYLDFLKLMRESRIILTDSGGIQEEAAITGVACVTLRTTTERQITLLKKVNIITGYDQKKIINAVKIFIKKKIYKIKDFGTGQVTNKIYKELLKL